MLTAEDIIKLIAASGIEVDTENLLEDENLYTQGFDSLDMANLELQIEQRYGVEVSSQQPVKLWTINNFVEFLNTKLSSSADHWQ
jgi:acyl carrier protein